MPFGDLIDPNDTESLNVIEDVLDLQCFCSIRISDHCPVHSGRGIVEALQKLEARHEDALTAAREEGATEKATELEEEIEELKSDKAQAKRDAAENQAAADRLDDLESVVIESARSLGRALSAIRKMRAEQRARDEKTEADRKAAAEKAKSEEMARIRKGKRR